jgi:hypothetical protein
MITPADLVVEDSTGYNPQSTQTFGSGGKPFDSDLDRA